VHIMEQRLRIEGEMATKAKKHKKKTKVKNSAATEVKESHHILENVSHSSREGPCNCA